MRGKLIDIGKDIFTSKFNVTLSVDDIANLEELRDKELDVTIKQHREKRSLDSNAYSWVLIDKIAKELRSTSEEVYMEMLRDYGFPLYNEDGSIVMSSFESKVDVSAINHTTFRTTASNTIKYYYIWIGEGHAGKKLFNHYKVMRGQSDYDTKEMSVFIDGIISEAKELNIEVLSPSEIERMKSMWKA